MPDTYDITPDGFFLGVANAHRGYPGPVAVPPASLPIRRARWDGAQWVDDPAQEQADINAAAAVQAERTARQEAGTYFRALDWSQIPDAETRKALRHLWRLIRHLGLE